jgi:hypothetical protein
MIIRYLKALIHVGTLAELFLLSGLQLYSQVSPEARRNEPTPTNLFLIARKESREFFYQPGMPLRMIVTNEDGSVKKIKGYLTQIMEEGIGIELFRRNDTSTQQIIKPGNIQKVRILSRKQRQRAFFALAGAAVYSGVMLLLIGETGPLTYILFIPALGVAFGFVYYFPATFIYDLLREHNTKKGWNFSIRRR